ncbi:MAG: DUF2085 domain-containing protein [Candidatus Bathyarchaeota archaeon]|nr:MAG: DUF2085 domain-containing protein [Candidatus Bathyarchaeota archaeon]
MELWRLLAHGHWFTVRFHGGELRLCARCSGYVSGALSVIALNSFGGLGFYSSLDVAQQVLACLLLLLPASVDWVTQTHGWRQSNNGLRFATGAAMGVCVFLFLFIDATGFMRAMFAVYACAFILMAGVVGRPSRV